VIFLGLNYVVQKVVVHVLPLLSLVILPLRVIVLVVPVKLAITALPPTHLPLTLPPLLLLLLLLLPRVGLLDVLPLSLAHVPPLNHVLPFPMRKTSLPTSQYLPHL